MDNAWRVPSELPDLRRVGIIAIDTEVKDAGLAADRGSSWPWRDGYVCGISIACHVDDQVHSFYFPIRHPDTQNFPPEQLYAWLRDHIASGLRFVTQNGLYDWGWLRAEANIRMPPGERLEEIGALATMVDENRYRYGLDELCAWRGLPGKDESLLREGCAALNLIPSKRKKFKPQGLIWQLPAHYVGPYAEADALSHLLLFENLDPILDRENTRAAYRLENDLLPMVHEMRWRGVRINVAAAERARELLVKKRDEALAQISEKLGIAVSMDELNRNRWKADTFDREGIKYPRTAKGSPSFTSGQQGWMDKHPHWLPRLIHEAEKYDTAGDKFVGRYILDHVVKGRIYAEIHPHRSEANGTRSFRLSYSHPPLQQMPSRDDELTPLIRGLFLPEEGEFWAKPDASQQEFRIAAHYAAVYNVPKASIALERYLAHPDTDFHALAAQITGLDRKQAKAVNFAKIYGAGPGKFATMIGKPEQEAKAIYDQYDRELPFLRTLSQIAQSIARRQGFITLYDGARRHFDQWAPGGTWEKGAGPCGREEAQRRHTNPEHPWFRKGPLYRVDTHNALNALIQGTAARHTKLWMRKVWREGIVPLLQMHDALECSVATREQGEMVAQLCVEAVNLKVPMRCDLKFGRNWADATHAWDELHATTARTPTSEIQGHRVPSIPTPPLEVAEPAVACADMAAISSSLHLCAHCHETPVGTKQLSTYEGAYLHPQCLEAFIKEKMAEQDIAWSTEAQRPQPQLALRSEPEPRSAPERELEPEVQSGSEPKSAPSTHINRVNGAHVHMLPSDIVFVSLRDVVGGPLIRNKVLCPFHDDHTPSCHIYHDHFYCFVCGANGDAITWLMEVEGLTYSEAVDELENLEPRAHPPEDDDKTLRLALKMWKEAKPIRGTIAELYLIRRHIDVGQLRSDVPLRFHPYCWFAGKRHPCLLALFSDIETNAPAGILRTALTPDGRKIDRLSLGRWHAPRAIKLWPAGETLVVGEGIETVLSAATQLKYEGAFLRPAWATGGIGRLATLPPITSLKQLIVLADNDTAGREAARRCAQTAANAGCTVLLLTPTNVNDFNDLIFRRAAQ
jgi:Mesyanzhinovviridae DNA polymerase